MGNNDPRKWLMVGFFLLPVVFVAAITIERSHYIIEFDNATLRTVRPTNSTSDYLDLSGLNLSRLDVGALDNVTHVKSLDLSKNNLQSLPDGLFSHFRGLEHLSLEGNSDFQMWHKIFGAGLTSLKTLNLGSRHFRLSDSSFFGLGESTNVSIQLSLITGRIFENPNATDRFCEKLKKERAEERAVCTRKSPASSLTVKICIRNGTLETVERTRPNEEIPPYCRNVSTQGDRLLLNDETLLKYSAGWYRLGDFPTKEIFMIVQSTEVEPTMLNELPKNIKKVRLRGGSGLRHMARGKIANEYLDELTVRGVGSLEVDEGVFENTRISSLRLREIDGKDFRFLRSLPSTLTTLSLEFVTADNLPADAFAELKNLQHLDFQVSEISELKNNTFCNLGSLRSLIFSRNRLSRIEPGAFRGLESLKLLVLARNRLTSLSSGTFDGLEQVEVIKLNTNRFTRITREFSNIVPRSVLALDLSWNRLTRLENGTFVNVPKKVLEMRNSRIKYIEPGTFDLPTLEELHLKDNLIEDLHRDSFTGLENLRSLDLSWNRLSKIEKGFARQMGELVDLNLNDNRIKYVQKGVFFGLQKSSCSKVHLVGNPLKWIQPGMFNE